MQLPTGQIGLMSTVYGNDPCYTAPTNAVFQVSPSQSSSAPLPRNPFSKTDISGYTDAKLGKSTEKFRGLSIEDCTILSTVVDIAFQFSAEADANCATTEIRKLEHNCRIR